MIDFEWYRSFISIYQHRSVSGAAKARILTQPAMSQHLAALEAEVGEPLFIRAPRKMIPTDKGKELYSKLVPLIESLEKATLEIRHASYDVAVPVIRIGSPGEYFTKNALQKIKHLNIRYTVQFGVAGELLELLQRDEVDFIISPQKSQTPGITYTQLEDERFVVVVPPDYTVDYKGITEIEAWLKEQRWLSYGLELPIIRRYWQTHFGKRPDFQPFHVMPDLRAILEAIENGMGISVLPTYLIEESIRLRKVKIMFQHLHVHNIIYAGYKTEMKDDPVISQLIQSLQGER
ncbi:LysR family transcriptional regulator [Ectobacillus antri]|jgi:DNA-binding transcriptional LysR family regulator|uniref:LysR family transcriptional regulator n=1 Tax=Ectobacillus antri TaxID=2486280 RepID=A0ABT6H5B2_9BACI|nr:LysR family transcriptional regulator [Ectobacillus antri]MDG4657340.1 LysR family transcriptional regulator [Ectobacillus antri]MDG5754529.1 LysR family transcriptional regulator [Ectobacillus antri]